MIDTHTWDTTILMTYEDGSLVTDEDGIPFVDYNKVCTCDVLPDTMVCNYCLDQLFSEDANCSLCGNPALDLAVVDKLNRFREELRLMNISWSKLNLENIALREKLEKALPPIPHNYQRDGNLFHCLHCGCFPGDDVKSCVEVWRGWDKK